ncbi:endonuclease MutS2 [Jeotgalibacillus campisalis]|uniref:Endonuclease MutS2 n=1 Tax=Jeotgalibacillus campisalis TaxID=220754 RepID=A0A0C2R7N6_9BACL|nr:endonuclease MutS2 [Jeotgalibacillus campisalis]KIL46265.1 DNA mismatch repair protein MutS [Jeotgalibacillus campisalis]
MNEKALNTLEFTKIKQLVKEYAASELGTKRINKMEPSTSFEEVVQLQDETDEAATVLRIKGGMPLGGIFDIRPHVKRTQIGGSLSPFELVKIASTIRASKTIRNFIEKLIDDEEISLPILENKKEAMAVLTHLEHLIYDAIDENGEILDSASADLRSIRQKIRSSESRIREKLESTIRSKNAQTMLSDAIITIRNDRYVIPVKQEYRGHYGGIVHDQSSSGQTVFVEPEAIVNFNNQLREQRLKEQEEIERILLELSLAVSAEAYDLLLTTDVLGDIDFMFSKAKYGRSIKATKPEVNDRGIIHLNKARHPLLPMEEAVANDIFLGEDFTAIVITGPNTGGKTVTLKTIGLCTLMAQAGLPLPVLDGSKIAVFESVWADIGDEQSIEQSLSTFSSHMVNIVKILQQADSGSLVLFDELGAGTDPQEGAALAISILDEVHSKGSRVVATTHYPELKAYGYNRDGVVNASVEFDVNTLSPTYRLLIGVPGRSNAFDISKRLGLGEHVIAHAKTFVGTDSKAVESMIASLETSRKSAEQDYEDAHDYLKDAQNLHKDMQKQMSEFWDKRDDMYEKARQKANSLVEQAKREAEEVLSDLRKLRLEKNADVKEHELIDARKRLEEAAPSPSAKNKKTAAKKPSSRVLEPGDEVQVLTFGQRGILLDKISEKEWSVQIGILKMKVEEKDLEFKKAEKKAEPKPLATVKGKEYHVGLELDLRGERFENALMKVDKYIDDALLAGYPRVSIIHGKGTGALRSGVQEKLKSHRSVKKVRLGESGEGGSGVTVVEFK